MEVVTFYSYKGGVGRTLLLAWVARALAARGKRVLALDLDLEAPGLPAKLRPMSEPRAGLGVVDLLLRFQGGASPPADLVHWCLPVATEQGRLWLLPAGAAPLPGYWQALSKISWESLFAERAADGARFFLWLRDALAKALEPDFLLIDARTGVTEMGAAAVGMLADTVVAVTNTSPESKTGLREVLRAAMGSPRVEGRQPLRVLPVLSRVPALLGADDDARLADQLQHFLNEEADPLTSTLAIELVLAVHHEEALLEDEQRALIGPHLRISADYERVLAWLVREELPGPRVDLSLRTFSQLEELIRAQEEVIKAYRESSGIDPVAYVPLLADALMSLAHNLADFGRREEALVATAEAVALQRELAKQRPEVFLPDLARSLNNLGNKQSDLGKREEALVSATEAVGYLRELAQQNPDAFLSDLAAGLNNLGNRQSELERTKEALISALEAVKHYRELAKRDHEVFLPDLALSLGNLGGKQRALEEREEALVSIEEAVGLWRGLAEQRPTFLPHLAKALSNLGIGQGDLGKKEEALVSTREAVALRRQLVKEDPEAFLPGLAISLNNLGNRQSALGQKDAALATTAEAVQHYRELAQQTPAVFLPHLAMSLNNLGIRQSELGRREEALVSTVEAITISMSLVQRWPELFMAHADTCLQNYVRLLEELGRSPDADPLVLDVRKTLEIARS